MSSTLWRPKILLIKKQKMTFDEIVNYRRSVRHYKNIPIDSDIVKHCIEQATLAPNSSNMQLWEFYHVTNPEILKKLAVACLGQQAATTAQQMVVFVTRQDLHRKRAKEMLTLETQNVQKNSPSEKQAKRIKTWNMYYGKVIPFLYSRFLGILGVFRKIMVNLIGLFRAITYQVSENDVRVVVHKTCALAAQTFMLAMANEKYDTCPMEGFDSRKVKSILNLPFGAEINMVVSCGIREENGVWGDRMRVPFEEVYQRI
jgi:nitroreductase